jgi:uncharacterized protein involved in exopolysaccharide biosynthesis/Mrp family chromosome partitioning ATPase
LRRRRAIILWTTALFLLVAAAYSLLATPLYTASTQLLIDPRDRNIVSNDVNPSTLAPDGGVAMVESQLLVITSDTVLRRAIAQARLADDPEFNGTGGILGSEVARRLLRVVGFDPQANDRGNLEITALREIKRRIGVKRSEKAFVIDVFVTTRSREKSVEVADAIAQSYLADQAAARAQAARRASAALTARLEELRNRVSEAETRVEQYRAQKNIVGANGVLVIEQQLSDVNIQVNNARARTYEARARVEQIEQLRRAGAETGATPEAVQSQTIGLLRAQYAEAARQFADLKARVGPRHPTYATFEAQLRDLRRQISDELARISAAARSDLDRSLASQQLLERRLDDLKQQAISTREAFVRLRELEREAEASRAVYGAFLTRARETGEQQMVDTTNARVISSATPPRDKSWPPRILILAIGLVVGLGTGTGGGLLREYFDNTIRTRRGLYELTGVPVVVVPQLMRPLRRSTWWRTAVTGYFVRDRAEPGIVAATARLRDTLSDLDGPRRGRSVLITSPNDRDGKSTVALHLAKISAAAGERVLLIDADFSGRGASNLTNTDARAGLADLLDDRTILSAAVFTEKKSGINLLPAGQPGRGGLPRPTSIELLQRLLEPARGFDFVIVDGGALLTDPGVRPFIGAVDDIVFLVRAGTTRETDATTALETLRTNAHKLRAAVLNSADPDSA